MEAIDLLEEVVHLAALLIAFCLLHHLVLRLLCEKMTHSGNGEHNLLKTSVFAYNLDIK